MLVSKALHVSGISTHNKCYYWIGVNDMGVSKFLNIGPRNMSDKVVYLGGTMNVWKF